MKKQFLAELKKYLEPLNTSERDEIIRFYEERFETGLRYEGKTEEEIVDELESPKQIARNVLEEYGYRVRMVDAHEEVSNDIKVGSIIGLILFDIFLASFLVPVLFSIFVGVGSSLIAFIGAMLLLPFVEGTVNLPLVFFSLGFGFLWFLLVLWLWDVLIGFITWLLRWHLEVFRYSKTKDVVRSLRKLRFQSLLRRSPKLMRTRQTLSLISVLFIIGGLIGSVVQYGTFNFDQVNEPLVEETYQFEVADDDVLTIVADISFANTVVRRGNVTEIQVRTEFFETHPLNVDFSHGTVQLQLTQEDQSIRNWFRVGSLFSFLASTPSVEILVPESVDVKIIDLTMSSGRVTIDGFTAEEIRVHTLNGTVSLDRIQAPIIDVRTSNGRIELKDIVSEDITLRSSNGKLVLNNVKASEYDLSTSNGNIELSNLSTVNEPGSKLSATTSNGSLILEDVYIYDVRLRTSNGSINYTNTDLSFILDRLDAHTTNGSVTVNVPYQSS